ncbi:hypothetical protein BN1232_05423 [Mycobacterium lentiflavum]|uniref:Uncharacterized protein n=1 Tax=Mycobacterium lentiflavum TaxID=141349 RepID=A0A0E4CQT6_MYCLN|nr:hypothetical protein [Mycobacterium lentiflavum]CQD21918.1 hypothetical protein BN1232_05423 [Mycobacterium lentiflavum]
MGVTLVAADYDVAALAGRLTFALGVPLFGLILLVIGLWERSRSRRRRRRAYPYPPPTGYPGQPYPGAPPTGYPGQPYPGPPPPGYPPYGAPPRRASGASTALITIGAVVLVLGIVGDFANAASRLAKRQEHSSMQVGECITQMSYRAQAFKASPGNDCADPVNTYLLAAKGGPSAPCPDGKREGSIYDRYTDSSTILCFALNLKQGHCYLVSGERDSPKLTLGDCNDHESGVMRVIQRIDGTSNSSDCPSGLNGVSYPTPPVVYCLERASPY